MPWNRRERHRSGTDLLRFRPGRAERDSGPPVHRYTGTPLQLHAGAAPYSFAIASFTAGSDEGSRDSERLR